MSRVRFAPSPTGSLHVGGARTALYNWLWAQKTGGKFILRIEDTDCVRNDPASYNNLLKSLDWLGLHWDEGPDIGGKYAPYTQSDRKELYKTYANSLIVDGKAYRCNCSANSLDQMRKDFSKSSKDVWKYPGICRNKNVQENTPHVIRFKLDHKSHVTYEDMVFGTIKTPISSLYDFIIMRENGIPLYNFATVIDDHNMQIDLVARGRDHMINTPIQILLYMAFGWDVPSFAHLPMLLNMKGEKLAKRDGSASVDQFKNLGFSANGLLNYLVRFGWAFGDQELFSVNEMINLFSWNDCKKSDGKFDLVKASAINAKNLMRSDLVTDEVYRADLCSFYPNPDLGVIKLTRAKAKSYKEAAEMLTFLYDGSLTNHPTSLSDNDKMHIKSLSDIYHKLEICNKTNLLATTKNYCINNNLKFAEISQLLRYWFTNRTVGPDIYQIIEYLMGHQL